MHPEFSKRLVAKELAVSRGRSDVLTAGAELEQSGYPEFFVRFTNKYGMERLFRFECTNYDFQAIAVDPVDPITRLELAPENWVRHGGGAFPAHQMKGGRPFFCLAGTRDYYTHPSHRPEITGERWERWRVEFRIPDLIRLIRTKFAAGEWE